MLPILEELGFPILKLISKRKGLMIVIGGVNRFILNLEYVRCLSIIPCKRVVIILNSIIVHLCLLLRVEVLMRP